MSTIDLFSWGKYPAFAQTPTRVRVRGDVETQIHRLRATQGTTLAYGLGRSYGDSCLAESGHVLYTPGLDRFIAVDWHAGVLRAEAGVSLEAILAVCIPRGWFLPVTPGTKYVTLGGAIANDVHGKNHHRRGTFGCHVRRLGLVRSDLGSIECSPHEQTELFNATVGGLGLTGVIDWAEIQLVPIRASRIDCLTRRFGDLNEFFAISEEFDPRHEFSVSWVDCVASGRNMGRGVYMAGDFAEEGELRVEDGPKLTMPLTPPFSLINGVSLRAFNALYWRKAPAKPKSARIGYDSFFYPLDAVLRWNRIYGPRGFQQYQALIPEANARDGVRALLTAIAKSGAGSILAVLKRCGSMPSPGLLSFPQAGITLALDFPQHEHLDTLFSVLDAIVREAGGRLYPAKDAHMSAGDFQRSYPAWQKLESLRDPTFQSRFWKRVTQ